MARYAALIYTAEQNNTDTNPEQWAAIMAEYNTFGETAGAAGVLGGVKHCSRPRRQRPCT